MKSLLNVNLHLKRFHFTYWLLGLYIICRYFYSGHFWTFFFLWEYILFWSHIYNWYINVLCINVETVKFKKTILNYKLCRLWRGRRLLTEDLVWVKTIQAANLNCYEKQKKKYMPKYTQNALYTHACIYTQMHYGNNNNYTYTYIYMYIHIRIYICIYIYSYYCRIVG